MIGFYGPLRLCESYLLGLTLASAAQHLGGKPVCWFDNQFSYTPPELDSWIAKEVAVVTPRGKRIVDVFLWLQVLSRVCWLAPPPADGAALLPVKRTAYAVGFAHEAHQMNQLLGKTRRRLVVPPGLESCSRLAAGLPWVSLYGLTGRASTPLTSRRNIRLLIPSNNRGSDRFHAVADMAERLQAADSSWQPEIVGFASTYPRKWRRRLRELALRGIPYRRLKTADEFVQAVHTARTFIDVTDTFSYCLAGVEALFWRTPFVTLDTPGNRLSLVGYEGLTRYLAGASIADWPSQVVEFVGDGPADKIEVGRDQMLSGRLKTFFSVWGGLWA